MPAVRVVADARLDALQELRRELRAAGSPESPGAAEAELIALSYAAWGRRCVDHLLGDFAFVLWDEREQLLLAARDHFGVRQLFYAPSTRGIVISTSANVVFRHPWVSRELDDQAVVDFLVHDQIAHDATLLVGIRRLRAGHTLVAQCGALRIKPYWSFPVQEPVQYRERRDYPGHLRELLREAVADRVGAGNAGVLMSGGIDSAAVAATAASIATDRRKVRSYTAISGGRMPEAERPYAEQVCSWLDIEGEQHDTDDYLPLMSSGDSQLALPIPDSSTIGSTTIALLGRVAVHSRVALTGIGPDGSLLPEPVLESVNGGAGEGWLKVAGHIAGHLARYHRRPPLLLRQRSVRPNQAPWWLSPGVREYYRPLSAWSQFPVVTAPHRSRAHRLMTAGWSYMLESWGGAGSLAGVSVTHPFLDLRVAQFCLRVPSMPWCWEKHILREAMVTSLPPAVTHRRKTPLRSPWLELAMRATGVEKLAEIVPSDTTRRYYAPATMRVLAPVVMYDPYTHLRPVALELFVRAWSDQPVVA